MASLPDILGAFASDGLTILGIPGGSVGGAAVTAYFRRRRQQARDILLDELRQARITDHQAASEDDAVAVIVRYLRAAREGVARLNLRLMAKVIVGQFQAGALVASDFLLYADALASLSRDEILVIGVIYRAAKERSDNPWAATIRELKACGWSEDKVFATATRSQRSGLLIAEIGFGALIFRVSPMLNDLGKTIDFDDALRREDEG